MSGGYTAATGPYSYMASAGGSKGRGHPTRRSPNFEVIDGVLYRKKLEKGFINYREVLDGDRRPEAVATFHRRRPGQRHLSLEETYKSVAENYWWDGMYFQIRDFVLDCPQCQSHISRKTQEPGGRACVSKTMASHGGDLLGKLRSQREAGLFCDITLRTSGRSYSAHKAVLAAVSDHFQEIFTEMDSSAKADIDLTGFSEDSLLSLLDFSYSSTLCVRHEDLPEVITMARHLGMWPAVEACSALMKEQQQRRSGKGFNSPCAGTCHEQKESKRKRVSEEDVGNVQDGFSLILDVSGESFEGSPRRNLRSKPQSHNGLPVSPSPRMKLMDFKSPSTKKAPIPRHPVPNHQPQSYSSISPPNTRLLRSSPGAAKEVRRLLHMPESPRRTKKSHPVPLHARSPRARPSTTCSPVRVKQEVVDVGEDEEDFARAQEKYKLMNVLGLQRTALLPRPEDLIGWRQKKRLRKLKANNYSLTKRRKPRSTAPALPYAEMTLSLPLCNPVTTRILTTSVKAKAVIRVPAEKIVVKRPKTVPRHVLTTDRSMRSKSVLPDLFQTPSGSSYMGRGLRRSVRMGDRVRLPVQQTLRHNTNKPLVKKVVRIKAEPAEYSISGLSSNSRCGSVTRSSPSSQKVQARNKGDVVAVKTLRYNSGRPATKSKLKRGSAKEVGKTKCKSSEDGRKPGNQGLRGVMETRLRVKENDPAGLHFPEPEPPSSIYGHPLYKVIKEEPADPVPVGGPFPDPPSPDLGKRQSKPPIKLLDSGFLFNFCRSAGGPMAALKKEEESVDICLTRSVSQVGNRFGAAEPPHRTLRARGPPALPVVKKEREERRVTQTIAQSPKRSSRNNTLHPAKSSGPQVARNKPKQKGEVLAPSSRNCVTLEAARRARLKQLRGPRSQAPTVPKSAHACRQCSIAYNDCDALMMHRLRHTEGKHWPCPLCSKTFFRLRNVRNHIHTHDPKLYKCRHCIVAGS